jgi:hypothetical protein
MLVAENRRPFCPAYRAYHAPNALQKADHLFNFCVTESSTRSYCLEHQGMLERSQHKPYDEIWLTVSVLVAALEIGNSAKHFVRRCLNTGAQHHAPTKPGFASLSAQCHAISLKSIERGDRAM